MDKIYTCFILWCALIRFDSLAMYKFYDEPEGILKKHDRAVRSADGDDPIYFGENEEATLDNSIMNLYSDEESRCLSHRKFLYNGKCYNVATIGPCKKGEWFVLDVNEDYEQIDKPLRPICKRKPCTEINEVWWPSLKKCIHKSLAKTMYCNETTKEIIVSSFGEGICSCISPYGKFENGNQCHEYYQRGPCRVNEVVVYDITMGFAVCKEDKCLQENYKSRTKKRDIHHITRYRDTTYDKNDDKEVIEEKRFTRAAIPPRRKLYAPNEGDGECHILGSADPCIEFGEQSRYVIDQYKHLPKCSTDNIQLNSIGSPIKCNVDHTGNCRQPLELVSKNTILHHIHMKNQKQRNN